MLVKKKKVLVTQSCPTLCDPMDGSPPGSSVHGTGDRSGVCVCARIVNKFFLYIGVTWET